MATDKKADESLLVTLALSTRARVIIPLSARNELAKPLGGLYTNCNDQFGLQIVVSIAYRSFMSKGVK